MKRVYVILLFIAVFAGIVLCLNCSRKNSLSGQEYRETMKDHYKVSPAKMPSSINFAGEKVPLDIYFVSESLDRELLVNMYWHTSTMLLLKRSNRWFPVIEPILKKNDIPDDFKYLALIESGLMQVVSPSGATGFWQFLKGTATDYGLEVNDEVDERYHVTKSTEAACRYLKDSYEIFGNWTLVAASYNAGKSRIKEELLEQQVDNYYDLYLNEETSRYVYRILAIKAIFTHPEDYGFFLSKDDLYVPIPLREILVKTSIDDLRDFAIQNGTTYKVLKDMNPWLRKPYLQNKEMRDYAVLLPEAGFIPDVRIDKVRKDFFKPDTTLVPKTAIH